MTRHKTRLLFVALVLMTTAIPVSPATAAEDFRFNHFPHEYIWSEFANDFGNYRPGGRSHMGNDIFGEKGSPVVTVADGFVTAIGHNNRSGYYVRIEHRDDWETWYMHLDNDTPGTDDGLGGFETAIADGLEEGMYVPAGTVIGYLGDSGNAEHSTPHTHFELHHGRTTINPYPYLLDAHQRWMRTHKLDNYPR